MDSYSGRGCGSAGVESVGTRPRGFSVSSESGLLYGLTSIYLYGIFFSSRASQTRWTLLC